MSFKSAFLTLLAVLLLPAMAWAQVDTRATFDVTKDFADDNPAGVEVTLSCDTGLPLNQTKTISESGGSVEFVVVDFDDGNMNCTVSEGTFPGYAADYDADGDSDYSDDSDGCYFDDINDGDANECDIDNDPIPVDVVVTKEWIINSENGDDVDQEYDITIVCNAEIDGGYQIGDDEYRAHARNNYGDDTFTFEVTPDYEGNSCDVYEENVADSAVESDSSDCDNLSIGIGEGASCTITNTVFFEGIPTLSQYGMAIMALLMLGVGFVGFRRFV